MTWLIQQLLSLIGSVWFDSTVKGIKKGLDKNDKSSK